MIRFECDYTEGAHPAILEQLLSSNLEQLPGYSDDTYCKQATKKILSACNTPNAAVHFLSGGTQANLVMISSILRPHQGVISASSGHINVHEGGAIEASGHKVLSIPSASGKIDASQVEALYHSHYSDSSREHMVQPGMVYISHPTENGTTYTKKELYELSSLCKKLSLPLYLDGARLAYALAMPDNDISLSDIATCCDAFYIGGTKCGALLGEAIVITNPLLNEDFRYHMKLRGAVLAKGRLIGIQFDTLFEDDLYMKLGKHAVTLALQIKEAFAKKGISFLFDSATNQQFPILENDFIDYLSKKYTFTVWQEMDSEKKAVRFCTSWATSSENVAALLNDIALY